MTREIDWEAIRQDYETGCLTNREIAKKHVLSHTAVNKRARDEGWTRPLKAKIRARADQLVEEQIAREAAVSSQPGAEVSSQVSTENGKLSEETRKELNAQVQAEVRQRERTDITEARTLCRELLRELGVQVARIEEIEAFAAIAARKQATGLDGEVDPKELAKAMDGFMKLVGLPSKAQVMQKLTDSLVKLVQAERQAYGIDDAGDKPESYEERLRRLGLLGEG